MPRPLDSSETPFLASLTLADEAATHALGRDLASVAEIGDAILLAGDLGAGKTALARGFVQALLGGDTEVQSPTFTLLQSYDAPGFTIHHFDLYRIEHPDELPELGIEDAFADGVSLIEWPDRLGPWTPRGALTVRLTQDGAGRVAEVTARYGSWRQRVASLVLWDTLSTAP